MLQDIPVGKTREEIKARANCRIAAFKQRIGAILHNGSADKQQSHRLK